MTTTVTPRQAELTNATMRRIAELRIAALGLKEVTASKLAK